jgi:hypothetical protein
MTSTTCGVFSGEKGSFVERMFSVRYFEIPVAVTTIGLRLVFDCTESVVFVVRSANVNPVIKPIVRAILSEWYVFMPIETLVFFTRFTKCAKLQNYFILFLSPVVVILFSAQLAGVAHVSLRSYPSNLHRETGGGSLESASEWLLSCWKKEPDS